MKKIGFVVGNIDLSLGSYRIWINDLNHWFGTLNIKSKICRTQDDVYDSDIIICSKNDVFLACQIKEQYPNKKVGIINLAADKTGLPIDFVIVGSMEEYVSMSHYENVFVYPLIEKMYYRLEDIKEHRKADVLRIGYHGSYSHLAKFEPHLKLALEEFSKINDIELLVISNKPDFNWNCGRPDINVIMKKWSLQTIASDLLTCDIGVVPNMTCIESSKLPTSTDNGLYNTDFVARFKNKSNAGRCFVFHQLGIPVIADLTPSNFHILADPKNGFLAYNKKSWLKALKFLADHNNRQRISANAKEEFERLYDPLDWSRRLYYNLEGV